MKVIQALLVLTMSLRSNAVGIETVGTVKDCVEVTAEIATYGDGSTPTSCMGCDPAIPTCATGCQGIVKNLYIKCDSVCLPDGYYFDPLWTMDGCWEAVKPQIKIAVERCGCNAGFKTDPFQILICLSFIFVTIFALA